MIRLICFVLLISMTAFAEEKDPFSGRHEMNGHTLKQFEGFEKNWKLVTVRFRKDTGEMRFTYANDLAFKSLKAGVTEYPKGSVFAKIGLATQEDPSFVSSAVPSGARRYQFMIRDKKQFGETDGWGYALFDADGKTFPGEPKQASLACAACHRMVPEKGYVFSQFMELTPFKKVKPSPASGALAGRILFQTGKVSLLPERVRKRFPSNSENYSEVVGRLTENIFQGTLDEIRPTLANEASKTGLPALLISLDHQMFSLVYPSGEKGTCPSGETHLIAIHSLDKQSDKTYSLRFCNKLSESPK